jgi:DNA modification methylase
MYNQKANYKDEEKLQKAVLLEKTKGTPDIEIGQKYGVTFRYIERLITKSKGVNISVLNASKKIKTLHPKDFKLEQTSVWSFKRRGIWATHSGEYRGNWSPYIPRNVILKYSKIGKVVLDYFCGAGTTAVEAKLLGRRCIAFDINDKAIELARKNVDFKMDGSSHQIYEPKLFAGDARDLSFLQDDSVDLICSHPPYANIIHYTDSKESDLSFLDIDDFLKEMSKVARESFRVLKPGRQCAILIGDTRRKKRVIPLGFKFINVYLDAGFKLKELVIKRQHNCKTTGFWYANSIKYNFLLLAHEYLPIFEKPNPSVTPSVKERRTNYGLVVATLEELPLKRKLDEIETTTVWVLPEEDFERHLNKNVINRYSNGKDYSTVVFVSNSKNNTNLAERNTRRDKELLFIKSSFLSNNPSRSTIEDYLRWMKEIVKQYLSNISKDGFLAIQTQDIRIDGYVDPLAKKILDTLTLDNLWLKEIVVVTKEQANLNTHSPIDCLKIAHQYLLIYEVEK